jgi:hypothetical protein
MKMNRHELTQKLSAMLDALALDPKLWRASRAAGMYREWIFNCMKLSEAGDPDYSVTWRGEHSRQFAELVPLAQRMGRVAREQRLRGVTINGEQQYVLDPALQARFGDDDDSQAMAELEGYPDFPFAHDIDGNRIPLLSARFPRPQRKHRPNSPPRDAVGEQSSGADTPNVHRAAGIPEIGKHGLPKYESEWKPDPPPPYARGLKTPVPPPRVYVPSPLRAELTELYKNLKEHGPANPRPKMPVQVFGQRADDPVEHVTGRPVP